MYLKSLVLIALLLIGGRDKYGHVHRSSAARHQFRMLHPCPATGLRKGSCTGYVVDHIVALECGGKDELENLQWQTAEEGRKKDKLERLCRKDERK